MALTDDLLLKLLDLVSWLSSFFRAVWAWLVRLVVVRWGLLAGWRFALFAHEPHVFQVLGGELSARLLRFLYLTHDTPDVFSLKALAHEHVPKCTELNAFVKFEQLPWAGGGGGEDVFMLASFSLPENIDDSSVTFREIVVDPKKPLQLQPVRPMRLPNLFSVQMGDLIQAALEPPKRIVSDQLLERLETLAALERRQTNAPEQTHSAGFVFPESLTTDQPADDPREKPREEPRGGAHTSS